MAFKGNPILAIDFDGTIRRGKRYADKDCRLMKNCKMVIENLFYNGCRFILWTCREGKDLDFAKEVLRKNDILQYFEAFNENIPEITWGCRKIYSDFYVDDLNVGGFKGWIYVYNEVMKDPYFVKRKF